MQKSLLSFQSSFVNFKNIGVLEEVAEKLYIQFPQLKDLSVVFVPQVSNLE